MFVVCSSYGLGVEDVFVDVTMGQSVMTGSLGFVHIVTALWSDLANSCSDDKGNAVDKFPHRGVHKEYSTKRGISTGGVFPDVKFSKCVV